ncbi:MAG: type I-D CRISPR-associated protein Cas7/Csc2 [Thermoleophilia bacterium]
MKLIKEPVLLSTATYLQIPVEMTLLDEAIIRSNEPEEVLTFKYEDFGNRFIIPWRKVKGKLRRLVLEKQRGLGIEVSCALKDDLCGRCPTCFMFGATGETSSKKFPYNILSRVYGETFISTREASEVTPYTQNAVREQDMKTRQALMSILTVPKETVFKGVVTLKDPTAEMASILIDNLVRMSRIGARSVEWGRINILIEGARLSDREDLSAYYTISGNEQPKLRTISQFKLPEVEKSYKIMDRQVKKIVSGLTKKESK